jgi:uncharacterized protein (DUF2147 family)
MQRPTPERQRLQAPLRARSRGRGRKVSARRAAIGLRAASLAFAALAHAAPAWAFTVAGVWEVEDGDAHVKIWPCGESLCGDIVWLKQARRLDASNQDPRLRDRPLMGVEILEGFRRTAENRWEGGRVYNPRDGQTYRVDVELLSDDSLKVRGCQLVFCGEEVWRRVE